MVMTEVSRSIDVTGVLSLCEDKRDFKAVVTTILSSLSDIFPLCRKRRNGLKRECCCSMFGFVEDGSGVASK